jgi:hypothetical protein
MSYAVVYGTVSGAIRRIIATDDGKVSTAVGPNAETIIVVTGDVHTLAAGESVCIVTPTQPQGDSQPEWENAVFDAFGSEPPTLTCALVDGTNTVQAVILADTNIDSAPSGYTMISCYSPQIVIGCTYSSTTGLFTIPAYSYTKKGTSTVVNVPAQTIQNPNAAEA